MLRCSQVLGVRVFFVTVKCYNVDLLGLCGAIYGLEGGPLGLELHRHRGVGDTICDLRTVAAEVFFFLALT